MIHGVQTPGSTSAEVPATLLARVRSEFLEMPGLRLTIWQAARLWGLEGALSERVLARLEEAGFLLRTSDGAYTRRSAR
jgi:hypothetical protein